MKPFTPKDNADSTGAVKFARYFGYAISPPVIFITLAIAVAWHETNFVSGLGWGLLYGAIAALLPLSLVIYLLVNNKITDISMTREERIVPYFAAFLSALLAYCVMRFGGGPQLLVSLGLLNMMGIGGMGIINLWWQISNHATSITSATLVAGLVFGKTVGLLFIPLLVVVCGMRLFLKRHTLGQILGGVFLALGSILILVLSGNF